MTTHDAVEILLIEDNPDDSSELTPAVLAELRNKLRAECARQRCTLDMA